MSMNPIDLLNDKVTPQVVSHEQLNIDEDKKSSLLAQFYPILLSVFHRFPDRIQQVAQLQDNALGHIFANQTTAVKDLLEGFAKHHSLPITTITAILNHAVPLSAQELQNYAGEGQVANYLHGHLGQIASYFPAWAAGAIATLGLGTDLAKDQVSQHVYAQDEDKKAGGMWRGLGGLIALLILLLLILFFWKSCQNTESEPQPATTQTVTEKVSEKVDEVKSNPMTVTNASMLLSSGTGDQIQACRGTVGAQSFADSIQSALSAVFGANAKCMFTVDQAYGTNLPDQEKLKEIFTYVKEVPNASIEWVGDKLTVNAPDMAVVQTLVSKIQNIAPNLKVMAAEALNVEKSVDSSIDQSKDALANLNENARPEDIAHALNIQIINFSTGSKTIPQENKDVLDQAAELIKKVPNVQLDVEGYTDSTGNPELNKKLSQRRAQSVVDYLVSKGVNVKKLKAVGYGQENPIADNATDQGKFRNRRIEFKVINTANGDTSIVDEQHAETSTAEQAAKS